MLIRLVQNPQKKHQKPDSNSKELFICTLSEENLQPRHIYKFHCSLVTDLAPLIVMSLVIFLLSGIVLLHTIFLQSHVVLGKDDDEDILLQGINSYRKSQNLQQLAKNDQAMCLAESLADKIEDQPCTATYGANTLPGVGLQSSGYQEALSKCKILPNHTREGVILPVCVPKLVPTLVLTNYTHGPYQKYLNDSRFTGAGLGSEDDWMVLVLATSTPGGSFAGGAAALLGGLSILWVCLLLGLLMTL